MTQDITALEELKISEEVELVKISLNYTKGAYSGYRKGSVTDTVWCKELGVKTDDNTEETGRRGLGEYNTVLSVLCFHFCSL